MIIKPSKRNLYVVLDGFLMRQGLIALPERHKEQSRVGTVIAAGEIATKDYPPGTRVFLSYYTGTVLHLMQLDMRDERHRILSSEEVLGEVVGYDIPDDMSIDPDWFNDAGNRLVKDEIAELLEAHKIGD